MTPLLGRKAGAGNLAFSSSGTSGGVHGFLSCGHASSSHLGLHSNSCLLLVGAVWLGSTCATIAGLVPLGAGAGE